MCSAIGVIHLYLSAAVNMQGYGPSSKVTLVTARSIPEAPSVEQIVIKSSSQLRVYFTESGNWNEDEEQWIR
jgi:hypothetical protein